MSRKLTAVRGDATVTDDVPPSPLPPPEWLSADAQGIWSALAPHVPPGRLTAANADLFAMYVNTLATYLEADSIVQDAGVLIAAGQDLVPNPALSIRNQADSTAARWAKTFGLTPDTKPAAAQQADTGRRRLPHLVEG